MTVSELIEKLQAFPPDTEVFYEDNEYGYCAIRTVQFQKDAEWISFTLPRVEVQKVVIS